MCRINRRPTASLIHSHAMSSAYFDTFTPMTSEKNTYRSSLLKVLICESLQPHQLLCLSLKHKVQLRLMETLEISWHFFDVDI